MQNQTRPRADTYDCGDGVPDLILATNDNTDEATDETNPIGAPLAFMILTIVGQLAILLAVLAGGDALIGAAAGLALLVCAVTVLGAKLLRELLFDA